MTRQLLWMTVAGVLATILVIAGAVVLLRDINETPAPQDAAAGAGGETSTSDAEIPARPDCPGDGAGGIDLACLGGETGTGTDKPTVVNVWAWWCGPCRDELPHFDEFAAGHPEYEVVGVHADANPSNGAAMLTELGIELPSYQDDDNTFAGTLGLPGVIPITVIFDGDEQVGMYAQPFTSAAEIDAAVTEALAR